MLLDLGLRLLLGADVQVVVGHESEGRLEDPLVQVLQGLPVGQVVHVGRLKGQYDILWVGERGNRYVN